MDDARCVGPAAASESYLNAEAIVAAALAMNADALHPGYGFLSERAHFASAVREAGLIFVGPTPEAMAAMGSKIEAKRRVRDLRRADGPGIRRRRSVADDAARRRPSASDFRSRSKRARAAAAGACASSSRLRFRRVARKREARGARGIRRRHRSARTLPPRSAPHRVPDSRRRTRTRHSPRRARVLDSAAPSKDRRGGAVGRADAGAARAKWAPPPCARPNRSATSNAGTCEFMLDRDGAYYFLEMNARLQVEHPVTELVYGIDLVQWQLRIAAGEPLTIAQEDVRPRGWAIEARIYAEDPANDDAPVDRNDRRLVAARRGRAFASMPASTPGSVVSHYYDPMLAKLIVYGSDRAAAIARLAAFARRFHVDGVRTNFPLLLWIARDEAFARGETTTSFLVAAARRVDLHSKRRPSEAALLCAAALLADGRAPWRIGDVGVPLRLAAGAKHRVDDRSPTRRGEPDVWRLSGDRDGTPARQRRGNVVRAQLRRRRRRGASLRTTARVSTCISTEAPGRLRSPRRRRPMRAAASQRRGRRRHASPRRCPDESSRLRFATGSRVEEHALLVVLEAMKMEHRIEAPAAGDRQIGARKGGSDRRRRHPAGGVGVIASWQLAAPGHDLRNGRARRIAERERARLRPTQGALHRSALGDGLQWIEATSFVSPKAIPQLADAADVFARIRRRPACAIRCWCPTSKVTSEHAPPAPMRSPFSPQHRSVSPSATST